MLYSSPLGAIWSPLIATFDEIETDEEKSKKDVPITPIATVAAPDGTVVPRFSCSKLALVELRTTPFSGLFCYGPPLECDCCHTTVFRLYIQSASNHISLHDQESFLIEASPSSVHRALQRSKFFVPNPISTNEDGTFVAICLTNRKLGYVCYIDGCGERRKDIQLSMELKAEAFCDILEKNDVQCS